MPQAIQTKFLAPTDFRGARVKARADAGSVVVPWDEALGVDDNHDLAAAALAKKLQWHGTWVRGSAKGWPGYVYVRMVEYATLHV